MPYIFQSRRDVIDDAGLVGVCDEMRLAPPGDLAYVVYRLLMSYTRGVSSFSRWAEARGAIMDAVDEFRERKVKPYEANKRCQNGDVV